MRELWVVSVYTGDDDDDLWGREVRFPRFEVKYRRGMANENNEQRWVLLRFYSGRYAFMSQVYIFTIILKSSERKNNNAQ